jgi:hypothetical protein
MTWSVNVEIKWVDSNIELYLAKVEIFPMISFAVIPNSNFFFFFVSYATCCPFNSKVISTEESGLNIVA